MNLQGVFTIEYLIPEHMFPKGIGNPVGYRLGIREQGVGTRAAHVPQPHAR